MSMRDQILATAAALPFEEVETPEWANQGIPRVRMGTMGADDYDEWEALMLVLVGRAKVSGGTPLRGVRAALVICGARDPETGERLFESEDVDRVGKLDGNVLNRLAAAAQRLNPVSEKDQKELEKNSDPGRTGAFSSVSRWLQAGLMWMRLPGSSPRAKSSSGAPSSESRAIH